MVEIIEKYLMSKKGTEDGGEDRLILGPNFYGVVDGATDVSGINWGTKEKPKTGGAVIADIIKEVFEDPKNKDISPEMFVEIVNKKIHDAAKEAGVDLGEFKNRAAASFSVFFPEKNVIWHIGDCPFAFVNENKLDEHRFEIAVDKLLSKLRRDFIKQYQEKGLDPFKDGKDLGREFVKPLTIRQPELQNRKFDSDEEWTKGVPCKTVAYKVINGFPTTIDITKIPSGTKEVIITTDGFPVLKPTLKETLKILEEQVKKDPNCVDIILSPFKRVEPGNKSFDDMAYLRLKIT